MTVRGVCFDLFNTLVSVGKVPEHVGPYTADILGVDHDEWRKACFGDAHDICGPSDAFENLRRMAHQLDASIPESKIREAVAARQRRFDHALLNVEQSVVHALANLEARGLKLALVSNASTAEVLAWQSSPLAGYFHEAVFSCECGSKKPDADIYQKALNAIGLSANECLFVGDGGSDEHFGAHKVGMHPVLITRHLSESRKTALLQQIIAFDPNLKLHQVGSVMDVLDLCGEK